MRTPCCLNECVPTGETLDLAQYVLPRIVLVNGVPGCGKTYYILKKMKVGTGDDADLALFATREGAIDFRRRLVADKDRNLTGREPWLNQCIKTVHSFIINGDHGRKYARVFVDEALMMHAGEILISVALAGAEVVEILGDTNQIKFINRMEQMPV